MYIVYVAVFQRAEKKLITNNILMAWLGEHENLFYGKKISFEIKKGMKSGRRERKRAFIIFYCFI